MKEKITELSNLEKLRKQIRNNYILITTIYITIIVLLTIYINNIVLKSILILLILTILIETYNLIDKTSKKLKKYKELYRNFFIEKALPNINMNNLVYEQNSGHVKNNILDTKLFEVTKDNIEFNSNNLIRGYKRNIYFHQADLLIKKKSNKQEIPDKLIFKGKYLIITLPKQLKSSIKIIDKNIKIKENNNKIKTNNQKFNQIFNIYSSSNDEVLNILTEKLQKDLLCIKELTNNKILLCLKDNEFHLAIYTNKESFLPTNIFSKINPNTSIKEIIEEFNLTEKILEILEDNNILK